MAGMRDKGSPAELEHRRLLAVQRALEGYSAAEVAEFLDVDPRSVRRWVATYRKAGGAGLVARPAAGRPPKLSRAQEKVIHRWLADKPTEHGFPTDLWTGPRLAHVILQEFGVAINAKYITVWLRRRGFTPQEPRRVPRQRDPEADPRDPREDMHRRLDIRHRPPGTGARRWMGSPPLALEPLPAGCVKSGNLLAR
jgi:transposase